MIFRHGMVIEDEAFNRYSVLIKYFSSKTYKLQEK